METQLLLSFIGASILLALMPGPDNILVLTESISKGKKNGILLSVGLSLGVLIHTTAAATGISLIIQTSEIAFSIIKYLGAIYLLYLCYQTIKEEAECKSANNKIVSSKGIVKKGFLMNILNPKVSLFFIALLPQFVSKDGINITLQMMILGIIFMTISLTLFSLIAQLSGNLSKYLHNPRFWNITKWGKAIVLAALAIVLIIAEQ